MLCSCAGGPGPAANAGNAPAAEAPEATGADLWSQSVRMARTAVTLSLRGAFEAAMLGAEQALLAAKSARDKAFAMGAKAWSLFYSGAVEEAKKALQEGAAYDTQKAPWQSVLEFRIEVSQAPARAEEAGAIRLAELQPDSNEARAIGIMLGSDDIRDIAIASEEDKEAYATYLAGFNKEPEPEAQEALVAADTPVVLILEPKSYDADPASIEVARLSCLDALVKQASFRVVDSASRGAAVDELELSLSGVAARDRDVALGQLYCADYVVANTLVKTDAGWLVGWSLSSASDGEIVASHYSMAASHAQIIESASVFVESLEGLSPKR